MSSLMKGGSLDDIRIGTGAYLGLHASDLLKLTHRMFIHLLLPTKNQPVGSYSKWLVFNCGPSWARMRLPDY